MGLRRRQAPPPAVLAALLQLLVALCGPHLWEGLEANKASISAKADKAFWHRELLC